MYSLPDARRVASKQSVLTGEERFVLYVPESMPSSQPYDVCTSRDLDTFYQGHADQHLIDCYVNGQSQF